MVRTTPIGLEALQSRGSLAEKPGSLAGLHHKRQETLAQYFTPDWLSRFIWQTVSAAFKDDGYYSLLDNSIGNAAMFRYADPERVSLFGFDIDGELVNAVTQLFEGTRFRVDIETAGMEQVELEHFSAAFINPPFSITLSSPFLKRYPGITHYGKFGPDTSALSHEYALAQALGHCGMVAAIVPQSTKATILKIPAFANRLRAVFTLPSDTFKSENVDHVATDLLIFDQDFSVYIGYEENQTTPPIYYASINPASEPIPLGLSCRTMRDLFRTRNPINVIGVEHSKPVITTPLTGDRTVHLRRSGRQIKLVFKDGATEARVKNSLYRSRLFSDKHHRYPAKTRYAGQFKLSLDVISMQSDPLAALNSVCDIIKKCGGNPVVDHQLLCGLNGILEENRRMAVPFGRTVYRKGTPEFTAIAKRMGLINRTQRGAAVAINETVTAIRAEEGFRVRTRRGEFTCGHDAFFSLFDPQGDAAKEGYWEAIHPPIAESFPQEIAELRAKADALGIPHWLSWDFQVEDLLELAFKPKGAVCGWQMALGKSRLAISLALLLDGASLLVLKSRLVPEMVNELKKLGISDYRVIKNEADTRQLGKINIVSYESLKRVVDPHRPKRTLAKGLRNKIANILCDEGGLLANYQTQQTQAVWQVGAKRRYILDGTPSPNYPREMLNLAAFFAGEERAYQPYSMKGGFIHERLFNGAENQPTGRDEFNRRFVTVVWATNEFLDSGVGAKREVPKINPDYLGEYRKWVAPLIKRRVQQEPDVSRHVKFPVPELREPVKVDWDFDHLAMYVQTAEEFAQWYRRYANEQKLKGKALNLTIILARMAACFKAANVPSAVHGYGRGFHGLTTKEIAVLDLVKKEVKQGLRPIVFATNPAVLHRLSSELDNVGITNLVFTGEETINKRTDKLNARIRDGNDQVMLASLGVTQDGLNLPQLNSFIFYNRSYKVRAEQQAIYRLIRPQQTCEVSGSFFHLKGSIDDYMGQLIEWKALASEAGMDYGEQNGDNEEFVHFDAFVYRFINSVPDLKDRLDAMRKLAA